MPTALDPQLALDERAITNPDLEAALERRLRAKDDVAEVRGVYKVAHAEVKKLIETVGDFPPDSALRVGRFRITKARIEARSVSFWILRTTVGARPHDDAGLWMVSFAAVHS